MPWLTTLFRIWRLTVLRDPDGALYIRWGKGPPRRLALRRQHST